jgi:ankyrin repeat protein
MTKDMFDACQSGDIKIIESKLPGLNVNCLSPRGDTPIMITLKEGHLEASKAFAARNADLSLIIKNGGNLLHRAVAGGASSVKWILEET